MDLDLIVNALHREGQAASYGAVAGLVAGKDPFTVMQRRPRNHLNSWVVAKDDSRPSKYEEEDIDLRLLDSVQVHGVLETTAQLLDWLEEHGA